MHSIELRASTEELWHASSLPMLYVFQMNSQRMPCMLHQMPGIVTLASRSDTFLTSMPALEHLNGSPARQPSAKAAAFDQRLDCWLGAFNEAVLQVMATIDCLRLDVPFQPALV